MSKFKEGCNKVVKFLRKNIYYVLIIVCIAAIGTMVTVALTKDKNHSNTPVIVKPDDSSNIKPDDSGKVKPDDSKPVESDNQDKPKPIIFISPVADSVICTEYCETGMVFSNTMQEWRTHLGIDFKADNGTPVVAVYDGVVASVEKDALLGNVVIINHANGLSTKYCSLGDNVLVKAGNSVKAGVAIGEVSASMLLEVSDGPHLHFETLLNGANVNPATYFIENNK